MKTKVTDINATGTRDSTTFLRGDGTWQTPAGAGGGVVPLTTGEVPVEILGDTLGQTISVDLDGTSESRIMAVIGYGTLGNRPSPPKVPIGCCALYKVLGGGVYIWNGNSSNWELQ